MFPFDVAISLFLNQVAISNPFIQTSAIFLADFLPHTLIILILYFIFHHQEKIEHRGYVALIAVFAGLFARYVLKSLIVLGYSLSRPYVALTDIVLLIPPILTEEIQAFPSGHMLFFFAVATILYREHKVLGGILFVSSGIMGIARIMVGVHYPTDIIAGACIGILFGVVCSKVFIKK